MRTLLYYLLAISHGIVFTLNIITAIHLGPIINTENLPCELCGITENADQLANSGVYGVLMCVGTVVSALIFLGVYPSSADRGEKAFAAVCHLAILVAMGFAAYHYVPMILP